MHRTEPPSVEPLAAIAAAFRRFGEEARGSSPLYCTLSPAIAADRELLALLLPAPPTQRRANLLFAVAHDLLLRGTQHPVARYYPSLGGPAMAADRRAFAAFRDLCLSHRDAVLEQVAVRRTQTNEVRRSAAFLPMLQRLSRRAPIALVEVGASAGLNLLVDRYRYRYGDGPWVGALGSTVAVECAVRGCPPPVAEPPPRVAYRVGLDTNPLDASDPEDARWLRACVWPEQLDRLRLLDAALDVARREPPRMIAGHAVDALASVTDQVPAHLPICVFHSATLPYLTEAERDAFVDELGRLARRRELYWLSLEGSSGQSFGAALPFDRLHTPRPAERPTDIIGLLGFAHWHQGERTDELLGRADMHGRWIDWRPAP